ncbi:MAG: hypothetical protein AAF320_06345, partial [Myxococcota bacterium]
NGQEFIMVDGEYVKTLTSSRKAYKKNIELFISKLPGPKTKFYRLGGAATYIPKSMSTAQKGELDKLETHLKRIKRPL